MFRSTLIKSLGALGGVTAIGLACYSFKDSTKVSFGIHRSVLVPNLEREKVTPTLPVPTVEPKTLPDGSKYIGMLKDGKRCGEGESWDEMGHYKGTWIDDVKCGTGVLRYSNGRVYEGPFVNNLPNGKGRMILRNGASFVGMFVNGVLQDGGQDVMASIEGHEEEKIKNCNSIDSAGNMFEGTMVNGKFNGQGTILLRDGTRLEGVFVDNILNGQGAMHYPDGSILRGDFVNNEPLGKMTITHPNGKVENVTVADVERRTYPDGKVEEGTFVNGRLQGQGTIFATNGTIVEGHFVDGELNGKGCVHVPDGTSYCGEFVCGVIQGTIRMTKRVRVGKE